MTRYRQAPPQPDDLTPLPDDVTALHDSDLMARMCETQAWVEYLRCELVEAEHEEAEVAAGYATAVDGYVASGNYKTVAAARAQAALDGENVAQDVRAFKTARKRVAAALENTMERRQFYSRELSRRQALGRST